MKKISVIIPVYNVEKYLTKCLESVINQTFSDYEVIIVNDGSPDNSQNIIDSFHKKYPKLIKTYIKKNGGLSTARNFGLCHASGDYILFVDSDDYIDKKTLEYCYTKAVKEGADIVHYDVVRVSENNDLQINYSLFMKQPLTVNDYLLAVPCACNKLIKRTLLLDNKITFTEGLWFEDVAFSHKIISLAAKNVYLKENLYYYLERNNSIMRTPNILKNLDLIADYDDSISFLKKHQLFTEYHDEIEFSVIDHMLISGITRLIKIVGNSQEKKMVINKYVEYVSKTFPNYKSNPYIKILDKKRKIVLYLVQNKQFWIIKMMLWGNKILKK